MSTHLTLDDEIREALIERKGDWHSIANGSGVSYSWLSKFVNERIPNPGYDTLRSLHTFLFPPTRTPKARR